MADEQSHEPLIHRLHVASGGKAVVAGDIANLNVPGPISNLHIYPQPSSDVAPLNPFATVPPLPPGFIPRPEVTEPIIHSLSASGTMALTAIEGMGGIGKTIVANELCHDPRIRDTFRDGILWFTIGKQSSLTPDALTREMALHLNREFKVYSEAAYRSLFKGKSVLVVLDDVWTLDAVEPFLLEPVCSRLLYTTRNREISASLGANNHDVGVLNDAQARQFLAQRSGWELLPLPEPQTTEILSECKGLILGLAMIGAALKQKPAPDWARIVRNLRKAHLKETGVRVASYAYRTLWASIAASVEELSPDDRERYCRLAILLEDMPYPATLLQQIWGGEVDEVDAAMNRIVDQSLAIRDAESSIRIHDFQLDFIRGEHPDPNALALQNSALLRSINVVRSYPDQFASQMIGRLIGHKAKPAIANFLKDLDDFAARPRLRPLRPALEAAAGPTMRVLEGHTDRVICVALTADGKRVLSASDDKTLRVWDLMGHQPPRVLEGHHWFIDEVVLSADGKRAISFGRHDNKLLVWDLEGNCPTRALIGHSEWVNGVVLSADGKYAVSWSLDSTIRIWDLEGNGVARVLVGHSGTVGAVAISADGKRAVSSAGDGLRVWDLHGERPPRILQDPRGGVRSIILTTDAKRAVSSSHDDHLRVWDLEGDQPPRILAGHSKLIRAVVLSADGKCAVSASDDKTLRVWDLDNDRPSRILEGHTAEVYTVALTPDGRRAVSGSKDQTLRVWDLDGAAPARVLHGHLGPVEAVAMTSDGKRAVSGSRDHTLREWDLCDNRQRLVRGGHLAAVTAIVSTSDGRRLVSGSRDKTLRVWDLAGDEPPQVIEGQDQICALSLSSDAKRAISTDWNGTQQVWNLEGTEPTHFIGPRVFPVPPSLGPFHRRMFVSGNRVVSSYRPGKLLVTDLESTEPPRVLEDGPGDISAIALTPDGKHAVSAYALSNDTRLRVWNLEENEPPQILGGHTGGRINDIALMPDGRHVISASSDGRLRVWDLRDRESPRVLGGDANSIWILALSAGGKRAVSGSEDQTLRVWDLERDQPPRMLRGHNAKLNDVALTTDGMLAATASSDGILRVWDLVQGKCAAIFTCDAAVTTCIWVGKHVVAGDASGQVHSFLWDE